jgi:serine/threonine protein phosphatase PrpC
MNFLRRMFNPPVEAENTPAKDTAPITNEASSNSHGDTSTPAVHDEVALDAPSAEAKESPVEESAANEVAKAGSEPASESEAKDDSPAVEIVAHSENEVDTGELSKPIEDEEPDTSELMDDSPPRVFDQKTTAPLPATGDLTFSLYADGVTRPLPPDAVLEVTPLAHAIFGQETDVGRIRTNNQDSVYSFFATGRSADSIPDFGLFVVADGMGGHQDGEKASSITVRTVATQVLSTMYFPLISRQTLNNDVPITETLANAIQKANTEIMAHVPDGGTTLSAAVIIGDRAYIAHVGDSRIYLLHKGQIEKLTRDHSLVQRLIELDQITIEEANEHPQKNVLYRALGQNENVEVDTLTRRLPSGGLLLICSDGLWNQVSEEEITDAVLHTRNLQEACHKLVTLANNHGGVDNVTVVLLQLPG